MTTEVAIEFINLPRNLRKKSEIKEWVRQQGYFDFWYKAYVQRGLWKFSDGSMGITQTRETSVTRTLGEEVQAIGEGRAVDWSANPPRLRAILQTEPLNNPRGETVWAPENLSQRAKQVITEGMEGSVAKLTDEVGRASEDISSRLREFQLSIIEETHKDLEELLQLSERNRITLENKLKAFAQRQKHRTEQIAKALDEQAEVTAGLNEVFLKVET